LIKKKIKLKVFLFLFFKKESGVWGGSPKKKAEAAVPKGGAAVPKGGRL
jgi:hypothetical protein